ncbi:MAG: carbohydrate ABC transporter permease [Clostridiales bacterium]|jgi:putative aldouronate transport system permease protein|nr:carbohydrate ABC transporter permease [Clostridiales bacterium]
MFAPKAKYVRQRMTLGDYLNYTGIIIFSIICLLPFLYVLSVSFTSPKEYMPMKLILWPEHFSLESYSFIINRNSFMRSMANSVFVTLVGTVCNLAVTFTGAYGISKKTMPGHKFIVPLVTFTLVFNAGIVPNFLLVRSMGMMNSFWALILPGLTNAWSLLIVRSFIEGISSELEEAAKMDGCTELGVFFKIILPLSKAAIATFTVLFMVNHWNAYFNAMIYMTSTDNWTLPLMIKSMIVDSSALGGAVSSTDEKTVPLETIKMAAIVLSIAPIVITYPFLQKYFEKGVTLGAVKG